MSRKVVLKVTVHVIATIDSTVAEAIDNMDYDMHLDPFDGIVEDTQLIDYEVVDSK